MTLRPDGKAYWARTLIHNEPGEIIFSAALLFVSIAIPAPLASAQQWGYNSPNFTFDSIYSGDLHQNPDRQEDAGNHDPAAFSRDGASGGAADSDCSGAASNACSLDGGAVACANAENTNCEHEPPAEPANKPGAIKNQPPHEGFLGSKPPDFNRDIYYKNKLEFSLDVGWLPINIPFPLDGLVGDPYYRYPLNYTLVPIIASLRWQMGNLGGPWILRGNWDLTCSGSITAIPRGPETRYFAYLMGIRRNFVPRNSKAAPYFDMRFGLGNIDAKGPQGVKYAQGQDFTFTVNMGSGVRYNFNSRYAISAGLNYMHISNMDLSQGNGKPNWGVRNYGINVYGPMVGIDVRLGGHQRPSEH